MSRLSDVLDEIKRAKQFATTMQARIDSGEITPEQAQQEQQAIQGNLDRLSGRTGRNPISGLTDPLKEAASSVGEAFETQPVPGTGPTQAQQDLFGQVVDQAGGLLDQGISPEQQAAFDRFSGQEVPGQTQQQGQAFQGLLGQAGPSQLQNQTLQGLLAQGQTPGQTQALRGLTGQAQDPATQRALGNLQSQGQTAGQTAGAGAIGALGQTPQQTQAFQNLQNFGPTAQQTQAFNQLGQGLGGLDTSGLQQTAQGDFLNNNPFLDQTFGRAAGALTKSFKEDVLPSLDARFARSGRTGSPASDFQANRSAGLLGDQLSNLSNQIFGGNFQQERGRQFQAQGQLPGLGLAQNQQTLGQRGGVFDAANQLAAQQQGGAGNVFNAANILAGQQQGIAGQQFGAANLLSNQAFNRAGTGFEAQRAVSGDQFNRAGSIFDAQNQLANQGFNRAGTQFDAANLLSNQGFNRAGSVFDAANQLSNQDLQRFGLGQQQAGQQFGFAGQLANQPFNRLGTIANISQLGPEQQFSNPGLETLGAVGGLLGAAGSLRRPAVQPQVQPIRIGGG